MPRLRTRILAAAILVFGFGFLTSSMPTAHAGFSLSATLTDPEPAAGENFGNAVAISLDGSSILIGAPKATASGLSNAGEAFLFDSSGNLLQTFQDPSPVEGEHFGSSVAIPVRKPANNSAVLSSSPQNRAPSL